MEPYTSNPDNGEYTGTPYTPYTSAGPAPAAAPEQAPAAAEQAAPQAAEQPAPPTAEQAAPQASAQEPPAAAQEQASPAQEQPATNYWSTWQSATQSAAWTNQDTQPASADAGTSTGVGDPAGSAAGWEGQNAYTVTPGASWDSQTAYDATPGASWDSQSAYDATQGASWDSQSAYGAAQGTGWDSQSAYGAGWGSQNTQGADPAQGGQDWNSWSAPQAAQQPASGWEPYGNGWQNPGTHQYVYTPPQSAARPPRPERKKSGAPKVVAMLLACSLFGFGGGVLANQIGGTTGTEPTVVYKSPEGNNTSADTSGNLSLADVAAIAKASVVAIETENIVQDFNMGGQVVSGAGSGVIISADGTIITNHHVVDGARSVIVRMEDGTEHEAKVLGSDKRSDIAVLKIDATGLTPAVIGDSSNLAVGEYCLAVGNPTGALEGTVTDGIISAVNRSVTIDGNAMTLLQMSAAVSPGNSGGGLFNTKGELIGIVNAKSDGDSVEGLGFAIPVNDAMAVAEELISSGVVTRPGLGVTIVDLSNERAAAEAGVEKPGVYINSVTEGSAAERAGLQAGDRVVSVEGQPVNATDDLSSAIAAKKVGDKLAMVVERNGQEIEIEATLGVLEA